MPVADFYLTAYFEFRMTPNDLRNRGANDLLFSKKVLMLHMVYADLNLLRGFFLKVDIYERWQLAKTWQETKYPQNDNRLFHLDILPHSLPLIKDQSRPIAPLTKRM